MTQAAKDISRSQPPLWRQLQAAARLVHAVRQGLSLTNQLSAVDAALRPGAQALAFHALRWMGTAEAVRNGLVARSPPPKSDALLCTALSLLVADEVPAYSPFTLVDQAVEAVKRDAATRATAALVNACLRRCLRERQELLEQAARADSCALWNYPQWWVERVRADHPQAWERILKASQQIAPMVLRVNALRGDAQSYCRRLAESGIEATPMAEQAVILVHPRPVHAIPGFAEGDVSVQSLAAQQAAPLLLDGLDLTGGRILDACAAPGGKTAHLLELAPRSQVTALEVDPLRIPRIHENLVRLDLHADVRVADAAATHVWWDGRMFDAVLLDAPCSASGIVRRHPDVRWLRRPSDIGRLAAQQNRLLNALWPLLRPGGRMLYCTCSVFREEGEDRIRTFAARNNDARALASPGHLLPLLGSDGCERGDNGVCDDGFFYALLEKHPG
jgi:16S rRNA (cytosine967-C5)-methyltransferase